MPGGACMFDEAHLSCLQRWISKAMLLCDPKIAENKNDTPASPGGQLHSGQWKAVPEYLL